MWGMKITTIMAVAAMMSAQVLVAETDAYLMVYHKDCDHSLHIAVSDDSYNWRAVNGDKAVVSGRDIAVQKGIRDPFIARAPDGMFIVVATDLHIRESRWVADNRMGEAVRKIRLGKQPRFGGADEPRSCEVGSS